MTRLFRAVGRGAAFRLFLVGGIFLSGVFSLYAQAAPVTAPAAETAAPASAAEESVRLSPDAAVEMAIKNNLSLESARVSLDGKKRKSDLVWNQFLPTVSAAATLMRDNWASVQQGIDFSALPAIVPYSVTLPEWHVNGSVTASLNFSFALFAGIQSIKADYSAGIVTLEKARLQLERDVRKLYNNILLLETNAALLQDSYLNALRQVAVAEANYRAGLAPRLTLLQAQVQVENMKPNISELENNMKALKANFAMELGLPYDTAFVLEPLGGDDFIIPLDLAELISKAASGKPDILELQKNITTLRYTRKAQALQLYTPFLNFNWGINSTFIQDPWKDSLFEGDYWQKGGSFSVTLGMSLNNFFPFTKEGQGLKDLDDNLRSMNIGLAQLVRGTELEIFTKVNSLEKTRTTAEAQKAAVELAEQTYQLTAEAYRAGLQDFQSVQSSALALDQAKLQLLTQQFNYLNDLIDLEYSTGVPFGSLTSSGSLASTGSSSAGSQNTEQAK